jgi:hypothetical protein
MSPELRRRYHIAAEEDVKRIIEARTPRLIVFPQDVWPGLRDAIERGYRQAALFGVVQVYERRPGNA